MARSPVKEKMLFIYAILLFACSFFAGLMGLRLLCFYYLPLAFAILVILCYEDLHGLLKKTVYENKELILAIIMAEVFAVAGFLFSEYLLVPAYHFANSGTTAMWEEFSSAKILSVITGFLSTFGYKTGLLKSVASIHVVVALILFCCTTVSAVLLIKRNNSEFTTRVFGMLFLSQLLTAALIYTMTDYPLANRHLLLVTIMSVPILAKALPCERIFSAKGLLGGILAILVVVNIYTNYQEIYSFDISSKFYNIAQTLNNENCKNGYATFWNANVLTEITNGEIEVWSFTMNEVMDTAASLEPWYQKTKHWQIPPEGKVFLLLAKREYENNTDIRRCIDSIQQKKKAYTDENWDLFVFEDCGQLKNAAFI